VLEQTKAKLAPDHPRTLAAMNNLAGAYDELGEFAKAEQLLRDALAQSRKTSPSPSAGTAVALALLGTNLLRQKKFADAETLLRECLEIREKVQPDIWSTFNAKSLLGGALLGQKKYADAEPLLLAGYEGMKKREATIPPPARQRLIEATQRLVEIYEAWDRPEQAQEWRKQLVEMRAKLKSFGK
jgi:tetratricopeptide (TPR) repeat protein